MSIRTFFKSKKIISSLDYQPAELIKRFTHKGKKYLRVAFTNRIKYQGTLPITDIPFDRVTGIRKLPSPFRKWLYGLVGKEPRATFYWIKKGKKVKSVSHPPT